jgi:hypothetical protein
MEGENDGEMKKKDTVGIYFEGTRLMAGGMRGKPHGGKE